MLKGFAAALLALGLAPAGHALEQKTTMYGYINSYSDKTQDGVKLSGAPGTGATTASTRADDPNPIEYTVPDIHFVMQSTFGDQYKAFLNLTAPKAGNVSVSNAWVEAKLMGDYLAFRFGKFYRPFGLYNEILDAVPTYIGIEPPELFDPDHQMLSRETNVMLQGFAPVGEGMIRYSLTTGEDERATNQMPIGLDIRYLQDIKWTIGMSYYTTGGDAAPTTTFKDGGASGSIAPDGGVLPWMSSDQYSVMGGYVQYEDMHWTLQASYFTAPHKATRNQADVWNMCQNEPLNQNQFDRFNCHGGSQAAVNTDGDYTVTAWYIRAGYTLGKWTPYMQYDFYKNLETVQDKGYGGDYEAGQNDNGEVNKWTLGTVYRPMADMALKLDTSRHIQKMLGKDASYGEVRFSFSYYWRM